jgi:hypothetical protein
MLLAVNFERVGKKKEEGGCISALFMISSATVSLYFQAWKVSNSVVC